MLPYLGTIPTGGPPPSPAPPLPRRKGRRSWRAYAVRRMVRHWRRLLRGSTCPGALTGSLQGSPCRFSAATPRPGLFLTGPLGPLPSPSRTSAGLAGHRFGYGRRASGIIPVAARNPNRAATAPRGVLLAPRGAHYTTPPAPRGDPAARGDSVEYPPSPDRNQTPR
jgi:hypothetical protein